MRKRLLLLPVFTAAILTGPLIASADDQQTAAPLSSDELAAWLDRRFAALWQEEKLTPAPVVDDGTFLRRTYLDLVGSIPSVAQSRDFLEDSAPYKRGRLVEDLLQTERSAEHLARTWRRVMVPGNSPGTAFANRLEPWLKEQFAKNVPYDEFARRLLTVRSNTGRDGETLPVAYYQAVGSSPDRLATEFTRLFLGIRIGCAKCHDHPFTEWKQDDFWGMAAFFAGVSAQGGSNGTITERKISKVADPESGIEYTAHVLWGRTPEIPREDYPREALAEWMTSPENPNFAATAVNRVWRHLCGRPLVGTVDDLDVVSSEERSVILDRLAGRFVQSGFDLRWLIEGVCKSKVYQRASRSPGSSSTTQYAAWRPLKTLTPEQVFDALEQALSLPVSNNERSPRYNGQRAQMVTRLNEAFSDSPEEFQAGIPQALMMMHGKLTNDATSLERSRTLRAVVDAPFLDPREKLETLYLATLTRRPGPRETELFMEHIQKQPTQEKRRQAYAEIFWGLLNSPEFVLSR